mmetsp:Transcript_3972/g.8478  ORF Transcript_3972/g.8478 Transcript_3972/m.8478 type:complete len:288 (-) Transcript_3972:83-946(-)
MASILCPTWRRLRPLSRWPTPPRTTKKRKHVEGGGKAVRQQQQQQPEEEVEVEAAAATSLILRHLILPWVSLVSLNAFPAQHQNQIQDQREGWQQQHQQGLQWFEAHCERAVLGCCLRRPGLRVSQLCSPSQLPALNAAAAAVLVHALVGKGALVLKVLKEATATSEAVSSGFGSVGSGCSYSGDVASNGDAGGQRDLFSDDLGVWQAPPSQHQFQQQQPRTTTLEQVHLSLSDLLTILVCHPRRLPPPRQTSGAVGQDGDGGRDVFVFPSSSALSTFTKSTRALGM